MIYLNDNHLFPDVKRARIVGEAVGGFGDAGTGSEVVAAEETRSEVVGHDGTIASGVDDLDLASLSHG